VKKLSYFILFLILTTKVNAQSMDLTIDAGSKQERIDLANAFNFEAAFTENKEQTHQVNQLLAHHSQVGNFTISFMKQAEGAKLFIYDLAGNYVIKNALLDQSNQEINLSNQTKGIYYIEIVTGTKKSVSKVHIQ
jgi:hypothetical protein